ncbi:MAG TPA: hypothetical protein VGP93_19080, partial [Polyangiaceae bacterium]|nr:hypothetical protein [Polyangiaceae bacterium]
MKSTRLARGDLAFSLLFLTFGCSGGGGDNPAAGSAGTSNSPAGSAGTSTSGGAGGSGGTPASGSGGNAQGDAGASAGSPQAGIGGMNGGTSAGGTGGSATHIVADCDGLGAVDTWEQISPPEKLDGILSVLADPIHAGTIYLGTNGAGIFKSENCGAAWSKVNTGTGGSILDSGSQWSMAIDFVNPDVLYAGNLYGSDPSLFKSTNAGVDWVSMFPQGSEVANTVDYNFFQE